MPAVIPESPEGDPYIRLLNKGELAWCLHASVRQIEYMIVKRQIPSIRIGNRWRFRLKDVERALERYTTREAAPNNQKNGHLKKTNVKTASAPQELQSAQ
jgi:excisionase family DNA binding protein